MTAYAKAIIAAILFALGLVTGWTVQGWRSGAKLATVKQQHADTLRGIADESARVARLVREAGQLANAAINEANKAATERIAKNDQENRSLRACVAAGTCGVRIVTRYVRDSDSSGAADTTSSTLGDAAVELDQATGLRVLDLRESVRLDAEKLEYLRTYAEQCYRAGAQDGE